jgi:hypothetical protein
MPLFASIRNLNNGRADTSSISSTLCRTSDQLAFLSARVGLAKKLETCGHWNTARAAIYGTSSISSTLCRTSDQLAFLSARVGLAGGPGRKRVLSELCANYQYRVLFHLLD